MRRLSYLVFATIFLLLTLLLCHSWFGPDIWYHLTWGRSLVTGHSFLPSTRTLIQQPIFANPYWLFQVKVFEFFQWGGLKLVSFWFLTLWLIIAGLWLRQTGAWRAIGAGSLLFLAFVVCAQLRFEARPEILSYLFLSLEIALLTHWNREPTKRTLAVLFVVQVLWTNCHSYFALGPAMGLALVLSQLWPIAGTPRLRRGLAVLGLLSLATLVSPFGWKVWQVVAAYAEVGQALRGLNAELMPPTFFPLFWPVSVFWLLWLPASAWSLVCLVRRQNTFPALLGLMGGVLGQQAIRNLPLALLLSAPIWAVLLRMIEAWLNTKLRVILQLISLAVAACLCVLVVRGDYHKAVGSLGTFGLHLESSAYPIGATEFLASHQFHGRIFADSYDGGYLEYWLPEATVSGDSYFSDAPLTLEYFAAIRNPHALQVTDDKFHFDALLINIENLPVVEALMANPQWSLVYADSHRVLYFRLEGGTAPPPVRFSEIEFYHGEDLTHWTYRFGVVTWASLALHSGNVEVMKKLLTDAAAAPAVPAEMLVYALALAAEKKNAALAALAKELSPRAFFITKTEADAFHSWNTN